MTHAAWNKLMHALHGNGSSGEGDYQPLDQAVHDAELQPNIMDSPHRTELVPLGPKGSACAPSLLVTYGACKRTPSRRWRATDEKSSRCLRFQMTKDSRGCIHHRRIGALRGYYGIRSALRDGAMHVVYYFSVHDRWPLIRASYTSFM